MLEKLATAILITTVIAAVPAQAKRLYTVNGESVPLEVYEAQKDLNDMIREHRLEQADALTERLVEAHPQLGATHFLRAFYLDKANKNEEASREILLSLKVYPGFPDSWLMLGSLCYVRGKLDRAKVAYQKFLSLAPPDHPQRKMVSDAIGMLTRVIANKKRDGAASNDGTNYLSSITSSGVIRWADADMPLKIHIADGRKVKGYKDSFRELLVSSLEAWSRASEGKFKFKLVDDAIKADIKCDWTDDIGKLADPGEGGHTQYGVKETGMVEGEIVLLTQRPNNDIDDATMKYICLHEVGHVLGIHGHSDNPGDVMFLATKMHRTDDPELSARDKKTVRMLYSRQPTNMRPDLDAAIADTPVAQAAQLNNEGNQAMRDKKYELAKSKYKEALRLRPDYALARRNLAVAICNSSVPLIQEGGVDNYKKACALLEEAIAMQEKDLRKDNLVLSLQNYSVVLNRMGREKQADEVIRRMEKLKKELGR